MLLMMLYPIHNTDFGLRDLHPMLLYIIRRLQDYAESKGARLSLALLDWEKAFDKVQHDKLIVALQKMGFSQHSFKIAAISFFVKDAFRIIPGQIPIFWHQARVPPFPLFVCYCDVLCRL